ncbi:hypothetical protein GCM10028818_40970 [Spirosoma horti]
MPLNDSNFLIWYPAGENQFVPSLPRPFVREPEVLSPVVWLVPGETISFYLNATDNSAPAGAIALLDEKGGSHVVAQSLSTIDFPGGSHLYGSFTVPAVVEGFARLTLGNLTSQYLWLSTAANAADRTAVVRFRNNDRLQNFRYRYLPDDFYQQFRIRLAVKNEEPEINKQTYRSATTGKTRHLYSEPRQIVTFQTPEYDRNGHRAIVSMMEHDTLLINGQLYAFAQAYKANSNEGDVLTTGEFAVSDENYSTLHRS